jgi:phosphoglycolate phosphatase-like HAD superfamily hydrolase
VHEPATPQSIFFDVDGVLIDSLALKGEAFAQAFSERPDKHDEIVAFHLDHGGVTRSEKLALIFRSVFGREPTPTELNARIAVFATTVVDAIIAAPEIRGASQALAQWATRVPLHAVSATPTEELEWVFEQRGLTAFFTSLHGWPPRKAEAVKALVDEYGYEPDQCVLVGDSWEDLDAARLAGVRFVQVSRSAELDLIDTNRVIRDLESLDDAIEWVLRPPTQ